MRKKVVVVIGDLLLDVLLYLDQPVKLGEKSVVIKEAFVSPGGVAGNISVALSRLGIKPRVISAVGNDVLGEYILGKLKEEDIDVSHVQKMNTPTGVTVGIVQPGGRRTLFSFRGASGELKISYKEALQAFQNATHVFISGYTILGLHGLKIVENASRVAKTLNIELSIDIGGISRNHLSIMASRVHRLDYVFLNEYELQELHGSRSVMKGLQVIEELLKPKAVFLKRGAKGSLVKTAEKVFRASAYRVVPIDTTGCGDAYDAGVIYAILRGYSFKEAARWGNLMGAYKVMGKGAQHLPKNRKELIEFKKRLKGSRNT